VVLDLLLQVSAHVSTCSRPCAAAQVLAKPVFHPHRSAVEPLERVRAPDLTPMGLGERDMDLSGTLLGRGRLPEDDIVDVSSKGRRDLWSGRGGPDWGAYSGTGGKWPSGRCTGA
jgi:hypothetical protein